MTTQTTPKTAPDFEVHAVTEKRGQTHWFKIGVAFANKEGRGYTVLLDAQPMGDRLVLLEPKPKADSTEEPMPV